MAAGILFVTCSAVAAQIDRTAPNLGTAAAQSADSLRHLSGSAENTPILASQTTNSQSSGASQTSTADANLLFGQAIRLYAQALGQPETERADIYKNILAIIDRIAAEFPTSIPGQRIAQGQPLGPIDVAALRAAVAKPAASPQTAPTMTHAQAKATEPTPQVITPDWVERIVPGGKLGGGYSHGQYPSWGKRTHPGIDIGGGCGLPVLSAGAGRVTRVVSKPRGVPRIDAICANASERKAAADAVRDYCAVGNAVVIDHGQVNGKPTYTAYFHLAGTPEVEPGPIVSGARIGVTGDTGAAQGCHLHFEIRHFEGVRQLYHPTWGNIYGAGDQSSGAVLTSDWTNPGDWFDTPQPVATISSVPVQTSTSSASPGKWGPDIVPDPSIEIGYRPCAKEDRTPACLKRIGLSKAAITFSYTFEGDYSGTTVANYFQELGEIDLAVAEIAGAGVYFQPVLLNGSLDFSPVEGARNLKATFRDATSRKMLRKFPKAQNWALNINSHRLLSDGTQRFALSEMVTDFCRACPILGTAVSYLEIGPSTGGRLVRRPIGLLLGDPDDSTAMSVDVLRNNPDSLQVMLNINGYEAGEMDGHPGPQTRQALMEFQVEHCLQPTGQPDTATLRYLLNADGFSAPCAGARLPDGITANTPLRTGIYVDDPSLCKLESLPFETSHLRQRIIRGASTTWGHEGGCQTARTDIRDGVTLFRGTCHEGNQSNKARWRFDIVSSESFIDLDMPTAIKRDSAPRRFTICPYDSVLRTAWSAWFPETNAATGQPTTPSHSAEYDTIQTVQLFGGQGLSGSFKIGVRRGSTAVTFDLVGIQGRQQSNMKFNPVEPHEAFDLSLSVSAGKECKDCKAVLSENSGIAAVLSNGLLSLRRPTQGVTISYDALAGLDTIGFSLLSSTRTYGDGDRGRTLFLSPFKLPVSRVLPSSNQAPANSVNATLSSYRATFNRMCSLPSVRESGLKCPKIVGACEGEGCIGRGPFRARETVSLVEAPGSNKVVATIRPREWVFSEHAEVWLAPCKSRFVKSLDGLTGAKRPRPGDILWRLNYIGEGYSVFQSGNRLEQFFDPEFQDQPGVSDPSINPCHHDNRQRWYLITTEAGTRGWVQPANQFDGMGHFSGDDMSGAPQWVLNLKKTGKNYYGQPNLYSLVLETPASPVTNGQSGRYSAPSGTMWVQVASRNNVEEAIAVARQTGQGARIFKSANGWYAITAALLSEPAYEHGGFAQLVTSQGWPHDSLLTRGKKYVEEITLDQGGATAAAFTRTKVIRQTWIQVRTWRNNAPAYDKVRLAKAGEDIIVYGKPDNIGDCLVDSHEGVFAKCADLAAFSQPEPMTASDPTAKTPAEPKYTAEDIRAWHYYDEAGGDKIRDAYRSLIFEKQNTQWMLQIVGVMNRIDDDTSPDQILAYLDAIMKKMMLSREILTLTAGIPPIESSSHGEFYTLWLLNTARSKNQKPSFPYADLEASGFKKLSPQKSAFHAIGLDASRVEKWVHGDGREHVFLRGSDDKTTIVFDGRNNGTFNYCGLPACHMMLDILPWVKWGAAQNDPSTAQQRAVLFRDSLLASNYSWEDLLGFF
ncbi:peptidoglycan DD-metalloendopeptidase family protein [Alisedimentitalea sp. MJ-SS2]|uniref:peptidoglycan DD-metalloendopeptidase family protein n=1 Tax=Aliisedimentitalea sp. MJ-SS2 TaxID=3049795 RepID=UPI00290C9558|nr:peptidoglycan DD-metalloendopeptidase family protein [Alisedimentitalea sp. MJ-SS2]MDU8927695.1 peptidoglycan DD-metalloendopeptidase family protein [Alisedimentitalea sp. MJ-SS2]